MIVDLVKYRHTKNASEVCFIPGAWSYHLTTQTTPAQNADVRCCLIVRIPLRPSFGMFSNKANASFILTLAGSIVSICHRASLRAFLRFSVSERDGYYIFFYLLFSNLLFEIICSITDLTASFLLPSAGISGEGGEDCRDKADAQSRFLWQD